MTLPQYSKKDFTLTLTPIRVPIDRKDIYEVLTNMITRDPKYFYCFWGCYGDPLPDDTTVNDYVEIDKKKYTKTAFTVVNGYEKVRLEEAQDSTIYHLPESTYGDNGLQPQDVTVNTYATNASNAPTTTVQSSTRITPGTLNFTNNVDDRAYVISTYCTTELTTNVTSYGFGLIELPPNVPVLWTKNDRLGVYVFTTSDDGSIQDNTPKKYKAVINNHIVR